MYIIMNDQFENFITTYKNIIKNNKHDKSKVYFYALNSLKNVDIMNFRPKQQIIINEFKNYYIKPTYAKQNKLNDLIIQNFLDNENEINEDDINEDEVDENEIDEEEEEVGIEQNLLIDKEKRHLRYPIDDVIRLENYSIEKMLNLYNITLEPFLDDDIYTGDWTAEDQLQFSWPYKKVFLKKYL